MVFKARNEQGCLSHEARKINQESLLWFHSYYVSTIEPFLQDAHDAQNKIDPQAYGKFHLRHLQATGVQEAFQQKEYPRQALPQSGHPHQTWR